VGRDVDRLPWTEGTDGRIVEVEDRGGRRGRKEVVMSRIRPCICLIGALALLGACGEAVDDAADDAADDAGDAVPTLPPANGDEPTFTDRDARFEVGPGDRFTITLESNATTGYAWELAVELPEDVVRLVGDEYVAPDTDLVGAPGYQELTFVAVADGSTSVQLWYVRSFDDPLEPADRAQFEVIVGTGAGDTPVPSSDIDEPDSAIPDDEDAITVGELLAGEPTGEVVVAGSLFDDGTGLVLCEILAESYPPQCVGASVPIANPEDVGAELTEAEGVRWSDRVTVLLVRLVDGELQVGGWASR
jgi:inhibitor of cysteine peptidase